MAISFVGTAKGTNTFTSPAHVAGDVFVAYGFRDGSNSTPTLPAGWTQLQTVVTNSAGSMFAYKVAVTNAETSGTWTNATGLIVNVYRGVDTTAPIGVSGVATAASSIVSYPAITLTNATGTSWVVGMAAHRSVDTSLETPPTGMTNRGDQLDATDELATHDTNGGVSSWSLQTVSVGGTSSGWGGVTAELVAASPLIYRQGVTASATLSPATTGAFGSNPTVGQLIVVTTSDDSGVNNNVTGVTDNKGNVYTQIMASASSTGFQMWYAVVTLTGASFTVSAAWTPASAGRCVVVAQEFSGFAGTPTLDKSVNTGSTGTATDTGATAATTAASELAVTGLSYDAIASTVNPGLSFFSINGVNVANASGHQASKGLIVNASTPHGLFTIAASRTWVSGIATFKDVTSSTLSVSVSESITVTESVGRVVESFINKSDSITITENIAMTEVNNLSVSDNITVTENVIAELNSRINVSESITLTEFKSLLIPDLFLSVSDGITVSEFIGRTLVSFVTASDAISITENVQGTVVQTINVSDSITITESASRLLESNINKSDSITVTENIGMFRTPLFLSVSDSITVTENKVTSLVQTLSVSVSENIAITESLSLDQSANLINVSENLTITEAIQLFKRSNPTPISTTLTSGGKSSSVASGNTSQTIDSGGKITTVDSGNKNTTITSGDKQTTL